MMSNSTWSIFRPVQCSRIIDELDASNICDDTEQQSTKMINRHIFSKTIQIITENSELFKTVREFVVQSNELGYLLLRNMPVHLLIDYNFMNAYIKNGTLYGLSVNNDVSLDDTVAILPNQIIVLSLNSKTYFQLGIIGQQSILNGKKNPVSKYRVMIDLNKPYFKPDKKNYQHTIECLKRSELTCDFIVKWEPKDPNMSPNSLEQYFNTIKKQHPNDRQLSRMTIEKCVPSLRIFTNNSVPIISENLKIMETNFSVISQEFIDWCGAQTAQIKCEISDEEVSTFELDSTYRKLSSDIHCVEICGFFVSSNVTKLRAKLKSLFTKGEQGAMIVHGFEDSPQCWSGRNNEHYKNISGENLYGIGQFGHNVISWCITDEYDFGIEKL